MLMNMKHSVSDSTLFGFNQRSQSLFQNTPPLNIIMFNSKQKQHFPPPISNYTGLHKYDNNRRKFMVYSVEPGASPSGPSPNALSWIVAVAIAIVVPFINYKWGPLLKKKIEAAMQTTEDVAEAVEKVAEMVEKVAEDIADDLPDGGELRKAVDFVEKFAERTAKDAGAIDEFIDKRKRRETPPTRVVGPSAGRVVNRRMCSSDRHLWERANMIQSPGQTPIIFQWRICPTRGHHKLYHLAMPLGH